jgi:hypothetical protein
MTECSNYGKTDIDVPEQEKRACSPALYIVLTVNQSYNFVPSENRAVHMGISVAPSTKAGVENVRVIISAAMS